MIGRVVDAWTSAIIWGEPESEVIIHAAPTDWIRPPKFDARLANHIARKIGIEKGDWAWGESASDTKSHQAELGDGVKPANRKSRKVMNEVAKRNMLGGVDVTVRGAVD